MHLCVVRVDNQPKWSDSSLLSCVKGGQMLVIRSPDDHQRSMIK